LVPLRRDAALALTFFPGSRPLQLKPHWSDDKWIVGPIRHHLCKKSHVSHLNKIIAEAAHKEIYGGLHYATSAIHQEMSNVSPDHGIAEPIALAPFRHMGDSRAFEQLVALVATAPSEHAHAEATAEPTPQPRAVWYNSNV
jgi:hypothetical protein